MKFLKKFLPYISLMVSITIAVLLFGISLFFDSLTNRNDGVMSSTSDFFEDNKLITIIMAVYISILVICIIICCIKYLNLVEEEKRQKSYSRRLEKAMALELTEEEQEEKEKEKEKVKVKEKEKVDKEEIAKSQDTKKEIDALGRMLINLEDIKEFYTWSQKQAKASFALAVSMCILGFVLMVIAILLPIIFNSRFEIYLIPAIGGIITELVAVTALSVYKSSLTQLNHYHKALHEDERFLSSVNLIGRFSTAEAQDNMLCEIIRSEIQMNLIDLERDKDIKLRTTNKKDILYNNNVEKK